MAEEKYAPLFARYAKTDLQALAQDREAMGTAGRLFANNCADCHGSDAHGGPGFPNLTDQVWLYGGDPQTIEQTLAKGRNGAMPAWGNALIQTPAGLAPAHVATAPCRPGAMP